MKVTGYQLREAIRKQELQRDTVISQFNASLFKFEGEEKLSPDDVAKMFTQAEQAIANLQTGLARYNLYVVIDVLGDKMTLAEGVKRLGGAGRLEKLWREAATAKKDRYGYDSGEAPTRDKDQVVAQRSLSLKDCMNRANTAANFAGALRAAVAKANCTEVSIEGMDPAFF